MASGNPAETYERYMAPVLFGPWAQRLVDAANPQPGERVLDVGCGTGVVARQVAPRVGSAGRVVGLDPNPDMLDVARAAAARDGIAVDWRRGRAEQLPFRDSDFDLVFCQFALMFFADRTAAVHEMHRVLGEDGRLAIAVWQGLDRHPFYQALHEAIERRLGTSGVVDIFAIGGDAELRTLLADAGFRRVVVTPVSMTARFPHPEAFLAGEIDVDTAAIPSMRRLDERARQDLVTAIRDDMAEPLRTVTDGDEVALPFHAHIATAIR